MAFSRILSLQTATLQAAVLLLFVCITVTWVQVEWSFRPETPESPMDVAGLVLGHMVALAALFASQKFVAGSRSRWITAALAALCYGLATAEYFLDAGLVDIPIAALWLAAGVFFLLSHRIGSGSVRVWFLVAMGIAAAELIRNIASVVLFGAETELPPLFPWIDAGSDLLICVFYLLGLVGLLSESGSAPARDDESALVAVGAQSTPLRKSEMAVRNLLVLASARGPLPRASLGASVQPAPSHDTPPAAGRDSPSVPRALGWEVKLLVRDDKGEKVREEYFDVAIEDPVEAVEAVCRLVATSDFSHAHVVAVAAIPADVLHTLGLSSGEIKPQ